MFSRLSFQFQKAEADLEYMEKQLKYECMTNVPENGAAEVSARRESVHTSLGETLDLNLSRPLNVAR